MANQENSFGDFLNRSKDDFDVLGDMKEGAGVPTDFITQNLARPLLDLPKLAAEMKAKHEAEWERNKEKDIEAVKEGVRKSCLAEGVIRTEIIEKTSDWSAFDSPPDFLFEDLVNKDKKRGEEEWNNKLNEGVKVKVEMEVEGEENHNVEMADSNGADLPEDDEVLATIVKNELIIEEDIVSEEREENQGQDVEMSAADDGPIETAPFSTIVNVKSVKVDQDGEVEGKGSQVDEKAREEREENQGQDLEMAEMMMNAADERPNELPEKASFFIIKSEVKEEEDEGTIVRVMSDQKEENQGQHLGMAEMMMNAADKGPNQLPENASFFIIKSEVKEENDEEEDEGNQVDEAVSEEKKEEGQRHQKEEETQIHDVQIAEANVPDDRPLDRPRKVTFSRPMTIVPNEPSSDNEKGGESGQGVRRSSRLSRKREILEAIAKVNAARRRLRKRTKIVTYN